MQETSVPRDEFPIGSMTTNDADEAQYMDAWRQELAQNWSSGGYAQMPNSVRNSTLSPKSKIVYEQLISYMWFGKDHCWPGQEELASKTGYSIRSIKRAVKELYERGYIEIEQRGMGDTNRYYLNPLSFARSFRPTSGPQTARRSPHENVIQANSLAHRLSTNDVTPRPVEPFYTEVPKWPIGSAKMAPQEVPEWPSNYTKPNLSENELKKGYTRSGSAAGLGVGGCSPTTIRSTKIPGTETRNGDQNETRSKSGTVVGNGGAARVESAKPSKRKKHGKGEQPPALPIYVEESLKPISSQFCDQSRKSSATSVAWLCADMRQRGGDEYAFSMVMDQVKDITIAKTPTIQARNEDGTIAQMRYFLSVLESTVDSWCNAYDEAVAQQNEAVAQQQNALQVNENPESVAQEEVQDGRTASGDSLRSDNAEHVAQEPQDEQLAPTSIPETIAEPEQISPAEQKLQDPEPTSIEELVPSAEQIAEPETPSMSEPEMIIETSDPLPGWTYSTAIWWADRLRGYLGHDQYECAVWPIRGTDRYGFVIRECRAGTTWEEYFTKQQASARWKQAAKK